MSTAYAGDLSPAAAWTMLRQEADAVLIDCRTEAEWRYVGLPDLHDLGRSVALVEWQTYPSMAQNPDFVRAVGQAAPDKDAPLLFLCRSGARSRSAAMAATAAGYSKAYNVAEGFEGDLDQDGKRGRANGWKVAGLPWRQG